MQCANTDCSTELLYLRNGSIQLIETKARLNVAWSWPQSRQDYLSQIHP